MAERFPSGPSTRPEPPPFFPRGQRVSPDRPVAVQGAKRRSVPLTARTDLESLEARERGFLPTGAPRHFHRSVSLPSAPLGLSVCLEPCKGHKSPISKGLCESRQFSTTFQRPSGGLFRAFPYPPPLTLRQNPCGPQRHEKPPISPLFQPISSGSANRTARHVE